jgi:MFS family permease
MTHFSNWKALLLYTIVSLFLFFEMAVQVSPSVMSAQLMQDLNLGAFSLGIMSGIYFYSYTAMQIPSGFLFDKYNPRIVITLSILVCVLGTILFANATNVYTGSLARLLMGSGSAFAFVAVLVVTADLFKAKYFATMTGITQMLAAFGAMAGQLPISILLAHIGWRHTLLVLAAIGTLLALLVWKLLKYDRKNLTARTHNAAVPTRPNLKKILTHSQTWYIACYACLLWVPMSSVASLWGVPFLTNVDHLTPRHAAFICSLMWLGLAFASPLLGIISTSMGKRVAPLAISALIGVIAFGLFLEFNFSPLLLGILLFFAGVACSGQALSFTLVKENNDHAIKATALAFNNMAVVISGAFFQPLIGKIIDAGQTSVAGVYSPESFKNGLLIVLLAYVIAFLVATFLIKEPTN